jgi:hypothetical protein
MNRCEDPEFEDLDTYIRAQLAGAARAYAPHVDIDARLQSVLEAGEKRGAPIGRKPAADKSLPLLGVRAACQVIRAETRRSRPNDQTGVRSLRRANMLGPRTSMNPGDARSSAERA